MVTLTLYTVAIFNFLYTGIFLTDRTNWFGRGWVVRSEWRDKQATKRYKQLSNTGIAVEYNGVN